MFIPPKALQVNLASSPSRYGPTNVILSFPSSSQISTGSGGTRVEQDISGGTRVDQDISGGTRVNQDISGGTRVDQDISVGTRVDQDISGGTRVDQDISGGTRVDQDNQEVYQSRSGQLRESLYSREKLLIFAT